MSTDILMQPVERVPTERVALMLPKTEAEQLLAKLRTHRYLLDRGIELRTIPASPMGMDDGSKQEAVRIVVKAPSALACGMGCGYVTAVVEPY